VSETPSLL